MHYVFQALVDLADTLRKRNVPVHGIGLQSHMIYVPTSPEAIKVIYIDTSIIRTYIIRHFILRRKKPWWDINLFIDTYYHIWPHG